jgi:hypothetical protein
MKRTEQPNPQPRSTSELVAAPALPWSDVARLLDLPVSTLDKLRAEGRGPHSFLIGRRLYVRQYDMRAWLDRLAAGGEGAS